MAKMGVAVWVGAAISKLPPFLVAAMTGLNFFAIASCCGANRTSEK